MGGGGLLRRSASLVSLCLARLRGGPLLRRSRPLRRRSFVGTRGVRSEMVVSWFSVEPRMLLVAVISFYRANLTRLDQRIDMYRSSAHFCAPSDRGCDCLSFCLLYFRVQSVTYFEVALLRVQSLPIWRKHFHVFFINRYVI